MPEELVPPVVAVVVTNDPGPWLEECLASLVAEDYLSLSVLVIDAASTEPLAARVARVAPEAYYHRLEENRGFGPSANVVTRLVEGSTHFLFCHDDVVLEPDCVRRMVEEAFRSNAGIVAPKLVDYDEPDLILQLGLSVDRFGAPVRRVGHREFDQAQHDEVREVFAAPGGCTLVRSDLFVALGGFDEQISMFGEDVDLCWRAHLAGARVVIVPLAAARHLEAAASRRRPFPDARALQWRHELRAVLKNYGAPRRVVTVVELVILSVAEIAYFVALGRRARARQVVDAWRWNLAPERGLRAARAGAMPRGGSPDRTAQQFHDPSIGAHHPPPRADHRAVRRAPREAPRPRAVRRELAHVRAPAGPAHLRGCSRPSAAIVVVLLIGSRSLIVGHLPVVGDLLPLPSPTTLLGHYFGGFENAGLQSVGPSSPALLLLGLSGLRPRRLDRPRGQGRDRAGGHRRRGRCRASRTASRSVLGTAVGRGRVPLLAVGLGRPRAGTAARARRVRRDALSAAPAVSRLASRPLRRRRAEHGRAAAGECLGLGVCSWCCSAPSCR